MYHLQKFFCTIFHSLLDGCSLNHKFTFSVKLLILVTPYSPPFASVSCFCCHILKQSLDSRLWRFTPRFSSKSFIIFALTFRSLIHLELTFMHGVRQGSNLMLLHVHIQWSQHNLLKKLFSPIELSWHPCLKQGEILNQIFVIRLIYLWFIFLEALRGLVKVYLCRRQEMLLNYFKNKGNALNA